MDVMSSCDESNAEHMSTDMLEDISDGSHTHLSANRRYACYKICGRIKRGQAE